MMISFYTCRPTENRYRSELTYTSRAAAARQRCSRRPYPLSGASIRRFAVLHRPGYAYGPLPQHYHTTAQCSINSNGKPSIFLRCLLPFFHEWFSIYAQCVFV